MANMQATKTPMPEQDPNVRNKNFKEVTLGYTAEMAINEAKRCLQCKKPHCVEGCPVNIHIPEFIHEVAEGNFEKAYEIITDTNSLPALSGRVCPQETQCESKCVRGNKGEPVAIGRLERFVADWYRENVNAMPKKAESNGLKVAVVGSGPSGLTCASLLAKKGYQVSLFEALHTAGGVLVYGIPEFRLPKAIVANEVEKLKAQGVEVMTDMVIGKVLSIDDLFEMGFKAVFVGSGAGLPMFMHIPGESLKGVCGDGEKTIYFEVSPLQYGLWTAGTGTFMDEIANMMGLKNCFADVTGWSEISEEQVLERNPDYIMTISMYSGEGPTPEEEIASRAGWENVTAVKNGAILNLQNNELSRPAPRLAGGAQMLADFIAGVEANDKAA